MIYQERARNLEDDNKRHSAQLAPPEPAPASPPDPVETVRAEVGHLRARLEAPWWRLWRR